MKVGLTPILGPQVAAKPPQIAKQLDDAVRAAPVAPPVIPPTRAAPPPVAPVTPRSAASVAQPPTSPAATATPAPTAPVGVAARPAGGRRRRGGPPPAIARRKVQLRLPMALYEQVSARAKTSGVSMNQQVCAMLAEQLRSS